MSSVGAVIENGQIVTSATQNSLSSQAAGSADSVNKDDFLQLLVAQMKYQDPLEPTENTEWVSQYAQFTQVEELQNMASSMSLSRASSLVGQTVIMNVEDAKGNTTEIQGNVDFVSYEGGKAYLSIGGELYKMDDLKTVVDTAYIAAMDKAKAFVDALDKLPEIPALSLQDYESVAAVAEQYDNLTDREKEFFGDDSEEIEKTLKSYVDRIGALIADAKAQAEAEAEAAGETTGTEESTEG
ncbi:MAG: hypothetical protein IJ058_05095 [Lachnospiraceae bacterium]|nr:hypothetical protein [Lachnospiraceae bacterium]